jgi:hypothetical protein
MGARTKGLQRWLNIKAGCGLVEDGIGGPMTRAAIIEAFRNREAPAVSAGQMITIAARLGCTVRQLKAVAKVEGGGSGWDDAGLLKCLWERHYLWRRVKTWALWTAARQSYLSNPSPGGYTIDADRDGINDSWEKLADATLLFGAGAAFECASFGKFQIMGAHWKALGYPTVLDFVWALSRDEAAHYDAFARFIEVNGLAPALRRIDGNPEHARPFAKGYNGGGYERGNYHAKIAVAWKGLS